MSKTTCCSVFDKPDAIGNPGLVVYPGAVPMSASRSNSRRQRPHRCRAASSQSRVPLHYYRDPKITEIEESQILRRVPLAIVPSAQVPGKNDYVVSGGGGPPRAEGPDTSCKSGPLSPDKNGSVNAKCKSHRPSRSTPMLITASHSGPRGPRGPRGLSRGVGTSPMRPVGHQRCSPSLTHHRSTHPSNGRTRHRGGARTAAEPRRTHGGLYPAHKCARQTRRRFGLDQRAGHLTGGRAIRQLRKAHGLVSQAVEGHIDIVDEDSATAQHLGSRGGQELGEASRGWSQAAVRVPYRSDMAMRRGVSQGNFGECWVVMCRMG